MPPESWFDDWSAGLPARFPDERFEFASYLDQPSMVVSPGFVLPLLRELKDGDGFDFLVDFTAVDYLGRSGERFDLIYVLYSFPFNRRIRVKTLIGDDFQPLSATSVYPAANWLEREVFDMFGIRFAGHPNLKRILLPEDWTGYPLRKDYSIIQQDQAWVQANLGIESGQ